MNEYQRGYQAALTAIQNGENPDKLIRQSSGDDGSFCAGWQKACTENGAQEDGDY